MRARAAWAALVCLVPIWIVDRHEALEIGIPVVPENHRSHNAQAICVGNPPDEVQPLFGWLRVEKDEAAKVATENMIPVCRTNLERTFRNYVVWPEINNIWQVYIFDHHETNTATCNRRRATSRIYDPEINTHRLFGWRLFVDEITNSYPEDTKLGSVLSKELMSRYAMLLCCEIQLACDQFNLLISSEGGTAHVPGLLGSRICGVSGSVGAHGGRTGELCHGIGGPCGLCDGPLNVFGLTLGDRIHLLDGFLQAAGLNPKNDALADADRDEERRKPDHPPVARFIAVLLLWPGGFWIAIKGSGCIGSGQRRLGWTLTAAGAISVSLSIALLWCIPYASTWGWWV